MTNQGKNAIHAVLFRVKARPGNRNKLLKFLKQDQKESMKQERGTLRFDVFQDPEIEDAFYVYEAYEDTAAFKEHKKHKAYKRWQSDKFQSEVVLRHNNLRRLAP